MVIIETPRKEDCAQYNSSKFQTPKTLCSFALTISQISCRRLLNHVVK